MTNNLKIPAECFVRSKDRRITNDVVFYYELKLLRQNGFFAKGEISSLSSVISYSKSTIWRKLNRLLELQLIRKSEDGYRLVKYDSLFEILGYDLSWNGKRFGDFKIHKVPSTQCTNIKELIAFLDIRDNLNTQTRKAFKALKSTKLYTVPYHTCTGMANKRKFLAKVVKKHIRTIVESNDENRERMEFIEQMGKGTNIGHVNPDVTLSLKGICRVLGLSNTSSAHLILQKLRKQQRLKINTRSLFIESTSLSDREARKKFGDLYKVENGMLFRTLPNKLTLS